MSQITETAKSRISAAIRKWIIDLNKYPGWREWNRSKISYALYFDDEIQPSTRHSTEFKFSPEIEIEHAVIMSYMTLQDTVHSLRDVEWYFRRYPFAGTSVTRHSHLTNCCELYYSRFYRFRERLKNLFDAVERATPNHNLDVGKFIKLFDKTFDKEIRARHNLHHRERFDEVAISRIFLTESFAASKDQDIWHKEHLAHYRRTTNEWASRTVLCAEKMDRVLEAVATALLEICTFLKVRCD